MMCVAFKWRHASRDKHSSWMNSLRSGKHFQKIKNDIASMPVAFEQTTPVVAPIRWGLHRYGF